MRNHPPITSDLMKNAAPIMFGLIIILGFFYVLHNLLTGAYPAENKDQVNSLIETLKNILIMAISFWFGSNSSSKAKDETISDIARKPIAPVAVVAPIAPVAPVLPIAPIGGKDDLIKDKSLNTDSVKIDANEVTVTPKESV